MKRIIFFICFLLILVLGFIPIAYSLDQEINNGLSWLTLNQNIDGNWGGISTDTTTSYHSTTTVADTLFYLNSTDSTYINAINWTSSQQIDNTRYLSMKIMSLVEAGIDTSLELNTILSYKNTDGGFGEYFENTSGISYTTFALNALKAINYPDLNTINSALFYLTSNQNADGGWGFTSTPSTSSGSTVYMTALVSMTLQRFSQTPELATAINNATDYLIAHQNADGGFPSTPSTSSGSEVYATALSYIALVSITTDNTVLGNAVNYLLTTQLPDGSWNNDPYSTALALRALYFSENKPPPPPQLTTGTVTGKVVDASTNQPLSNVSVVLNAEPGINTLTDIFGDFTLSDIPAGIQTIDISLTGYVTVQFYDGDPDAEGVLIDETTA